jgi:hypothetical protein
LPIPEDGQWLRGTGYHELLGKCFTEQTFDDEAPHGWPPPQLLSILALAQHHGLPTRLLDWTWKSRVAAYFAALEPPPDLSAVSAVELAVWALRVDFIGSQWGRKYGDPRAPTVDLVTAPRASNPNLSAQAGLFTVDRTSSPMPFEEVIWEAAEKAKAKGDSVAALQWPPIYKFVLPRSQARKLLRLLGFESTTAATVFPGYGGVVEAIRERGLWDWKE